MKTTIYKFDDFYLNLKSRNLFYRNEIVKINQRAFDVLLVLIEQAGEVVEKRDILKKVWQGSFVEENTLAVHISALRKIFAETSEGVKFIETIPGRGYCFVAEVSEIRPSETLPNISKNEKNQINEEAYQLYLKGKYLINQNGNRDNRLAGWMQALEWFERAVEKDPNFAAAYAWIGNVYCFIFSDTLASFAEVYPKAKTALQMALKTDETLSEGYDLKGRIHTLFEYNFAEARLAFNRAIELDSQNSRAFHWKGFIHTLQGEFSEALEMQQKAIQLAPDSLLYNFGQSRIFYYMGEYNKAVAHLKETLKLDNRYTYGLNLLALNYIELGLLEDALAAMKRYKEIQPCVEIEIMQAYIYSEMGEKTQSLQILDKVLSEENPVTIDFSQIAAVFASLGEVEKSFHFLEKSFQKHDTDIIILKVDPRYKNLHQDARFNEFLIKLGLN